MEFEMSRATSTLEWWIPDLREELQFAIAEAVTAIEQAIPVEFV